MSRLEEKAKPILEPLIRGVKSKIPVAQQTIIVRWVLKTAMMHEYLDQTQPVYFTSNEFRSFMESFTIPHDSLFFLAFYGGRRNVTTRELQLPLLLTRQDMNRTAALKGYTATFQIGNLVLQMFTYRRPQEFDPFDIRLFLPSPLNDLKWSDLAIQIWPNNRVVTWPPPVVCGDKGFEAFANRWIKVRRPSG